MPDIKPAKESPVQPPKTERIEFPKSAKIALRSLNEDYQRKLGEIVESVAEDKDLKPDQGWQFDQKTLAFVRQV